MERVEVHGPHKTKELQVRDVNMEKKEMINSNKQNMTIMVIKSSSQPSYKECVFVGILQVV